MRNFIALLLSSLAFSQALADESVLYATVGKWSVRFDSSVGGCFIAGTYTEGDTVRIGLTSKYKNGYLMIGNTKWASIQEGKKYNLSFAFDNGSPWSGTFTGINHGGSIFLMNVFTDGKFLADFAQKQSLVISYESRIVTRLPLPAAFAAVQSMLECQKKIDGLVASQDPFAKPQSPTNQDEFR
jgi:hypothetical protein